MRAWVIIPARLASTRLPRKVLLAKTGRTVLEHTWRRARRAKTVGRVVVATPDREIYRRAAAFGAEVVMTSDAHESGTSRVLEAYLNLGGRAAAEVVVNVQADEPGVWPRDIDGLVRLLEDRVPDPELDPDVPASKVKLPSPYHVATLWCPLEPGDLENPNCVKVVRGGRRAWWFTRLPHPGADRHIGVYAFRGDVLPLCVSGGDLAAAESLEQLNFIQAGVRVGCRRGRRTTAIDTREDYDHFVNAEAARVAKLHETNRKYDWSAYKERYRDKKRREAGGGDDGPSPE